MVTFHNLVICFCLSNFSLKFRGEGVQTPKTPPSYGLVKNKDVGNEVIVRAGIRTEQGDGIRFEPAPHLPDLVTYSSLQSLTPYYIVTLIV